MLSLRIRPILALLSVAVVGSAVAMYSVRQKASTPSQTANAELAENAIAAEAVQIDGQDMAELRAATIAEAALASPEPIAHMYETLVKCPEEDLAVNAVDLSP